MLDSAPTWTCGNNCTDRLSLTARDKPLIAHDPFAQFKAQTNFADLGPGWRCHNFSASRNEVFVVKFYNLNRTDQLNENSRIGAFAPSPDTTTYER